MPMGIKSINEPEGPGRTTMLTPNSINEPLAGEETISKLTPVLSALSPTEATIGDESFTLAISGTGFVAESVIMFAGQEEPTTLGEGTVSTGVDMDVWHGPDTVPVQVKNGPLLSNILYFTFHAAPEADEEEAVAEESGVRHRRGRPTMTLPGKRKQR
jgi:hypothetical protein